MHATHPTFEIFQTVDEIVYYIAMFTWTTKIKTNESYLTFNVLYIKVDFIIIIMSLFCVPNVK